MDFSGTAIITQCPHALQPEKKYILCMPCVIIKTSKATSAACICLCPFLQCVMRRPCGSCFCLWLPSVRPERSSPVWQPSPSLWAYSPLCCSAIYSASTSTSVRPHILFLDMEKSMYFWATLLFHVLFKTKLQLYTVLTLASIVACSYSVEQTEHLRVHYSSAPSTQPQRHKERPSEGARCPLG